MITSCYRTSNLPSCRKVSLTSMRFPRTVAHRQGGAFKGATMENIIGKTFNRLTVTGYAPTIRLKNKTRNRVFCKCKCGNTKIVWISELKRGSGGTGSCGCYRSEILRTHAITHGLSNTIEYRRWRGMITRCENPRYARFKDYGGRGIKVCKRWRESFLNFLKDMGKRPDGMSLDRINVNGNYEPQNCRWASRKDQMNNMRPRKLLEQISTEDLIAELKNRRDYAITMENRRVDKDIEPF